MTISVWVHEFQDWDKSIGPLEIKNEALWKAMSSRYRKLLRETLPEIDYLVLTVVETQVNAAQDPKLLAKLVEVIDNECRAAGKRLILRSFVWHPQEMKVFLASLALLPKDVIIQSKCVPQDWHLRGSDNPVIGAMGGREEQVEFDIGGEYFKLDYVACAFTDILQSQLKYAAARGVKGIAVRFNRFDHSAYGQAQEANLWFSGYWASGKSLDPLVAWKDYATATFGAKAAPVMIEALKPTGQVIAEALCVQRETFGDARALVPAMRGGPQDNPFLMHWSPARWDSSLQDALDKISTGDPQTIRRKTASYATALASAARSLTLIDSVEDDLPEGAYPFFRWKLEENRFVLIMCCEAELAWLKTKQCRKVADQAKKQALTAEIRGHLANMRKRLAAEGDKKVTLLWRGKTHSLKRGSYNDFAAWIDCFGKYALGSGSNPPVQFDMPFTAKTKAEALAWQAAARARLLQLVQRQAPRYTSQEVPLALQVGAAGQGGVHLAARLFPSEQQVRRPVQRALGSAQGQRTVSGHALSAWARRQGGTGLQCYGTLPCLCRSFCAGRIRCPGSFLSSPQVRGQRVVGPVSLRGHPGLSAAGRCPADRRGRAIHGRRVDDVDRRVRRTSETGPGQRLDVHHRRAVFSSQLSLLATAGAWATDGHV